MSAPGSKWTAQRSSVELENIATEVHRKTGNRVERVYTLIDVCKGCKKVVRIHLPHPDELYRVSDSTTRDAVTFPPTVQAQSNFGNVATAHGISVVLSRIDLASGQIWSYDSSTEVARWDRFQVFAQRLWDQHVAEHPDCTEPTAVRVKQGVETISDVLYGIPGVYQSDIDLLFTQQGFPVLSYEDTERWKGYMVIARTVTRELVKQLGRQVRFVYEHPTEKLDNRVLDVELLGGGTEPRPLTTTNISPFRSAVLDIEFSELQLNS